MNTTTEWNNVCKNKANEILKEVVGDLSSLKGYIPIYEVIQSYVGDVDIIISMDYKFPPGVSAFATKDMNLGWIIVVNGLETTERQRFSAAHELGHIALITNQPMKVFCSNEKESWHEKLCDRFAGDILMPDEMIRDHYISNPSPYLEDIAKAFKVSTQVAEIQLKRLGLSFKTAKV